MSAAAGLLNGVITDAYFAPESDTSNQWVQVEKKLLEKYAPSLWAKSGLDGNTQYGVALAYTFVQALEKAGTNPTRQSLDGCHQPRRQKLRDPGLRAPQLLEHGSHYGFEGEEVVKLESSAPPAVTPTGNWIGAVPISPVYVTKPGSGPITKYTGPTSTPPKSLSSSA